ncbi:MAG: nucleoside triphosphate pyrophosphohydrolase [Candidatus Kerfeldbacteria bacterium]|nr:nucleoside triphosphate pyrophosphohydrolase [Candidatus Kerfeldbacteria bacterium]
MKKIYYNKVIRDNIPQRIAAAGADYHVRTLPKKIFERELIKKVEEEASALPKAKDTAELVSELADVMEVIAEIQKLKKIRSTDITRARKVNMKKKGGFRKRLYLSWAEDNGYRTNEKRNVKK